MNHGDNTCEIIMLPRWGIGPACVVHTVFVVYLAAEETTQVVF